MNKGKDQGDIYNGHSRVPPTSERHSCHIPDLGVPQDRSYPQTYLFLTNGALRCFHPQASPTSFYNLLRSGLALGDNVVARLSFAAAAPPALIRLGLANLVVEVGLDCRMS